MNTRNRRGSKLALSILGLAAAVPLLAVSASAGLEGGNFLIRATNADNTSGFAGIGGVGTPGNPGGNPGGPGEGEGPGTGPTEPEAVVLATYSCGPASIEITDRMVELSKSNEALFAAGKADETVAHADGWKVISGTASGAFQSFPTEGTMPTQMRLAATTTGASLAYYSPSGAGCALSDNRAPAVNKTYFYSSAYGISEGRWLMEDGKLSKVQATRQSSGLITISRPAPSNRYPTSINPTGSHQLNFTITMPTAVDGADELKVVRTEDDGMIYHYGKIEDVNWAPAAQRTNAPNYVDVRSNGLIWSIGWKDANGNPQSTMPTGATYAAQVADYNAKSGHNWDGKLPQLTDFDLSIPFTPTAP